MRAAWAFFLGRSREEDRWRSLPPRLNESLEERFARECERKPELNEVTVANKEASTRSAGVHEMRRIHQVVKLERERARKQLKTTRRSHVHSLNRDSSECDSVIAGGEGDSAIADGGGYLGSANNAADSVIARDGGNSVAAGIGGNSEIAGNCGD